MSKIQFFEKKGPFPLKEIIKKIGFVNNDPSFKVKNHIRRIKNNLNL